MIDSKGLITKSRLDSLTEQKKKYAKDTKEMKELIDVVKEIKPQAIIGLSTIGGAFSEEVIKEMAKINERPIIFALSNPTDKSECTAEEAYKHTEVSLSFSSKKTRFFSSYCSFFRVKPSLPLAVPSKTSK